MNRQICFLGKTISLSSLAFILGTIFVVLYIWHLGFYALMNPDEGRYAEIPREMLASGDFITPRLNGVEYFEKPALQYWLTALFMSIFGQNEFAARLFPALCAIGGIFMTGLLGTKMFNRRVGILASAILGTSLLYFVLGQINILDMGVSFFMTVSLATFYLYTMENKAYWIYIFYIAMALGTLTKGLVAIVLTGFIIFVYAICTKQFRLLLKVLSPVGILLFFIITVPWFYLVCKANPDFFYFFFIHEHFLRYLTKIHDRYQPFYFFIPCIILGVFPWTGFLLTAICQSPKKLWQKFKTHPDRLKFIYLGLWALLIFLFYSKSDSKLIPYILPCFAPLAIIMAEQILKFKHFKASIIINALLSFIWIAAFAIAAYRTDFLTVREYLLFGCLFIAVLLFSSVGNLFLYFKRKDYKSIIVVGVVSGLLFCVALQPIMTEVAEHRTSKFISQTINEWKTSDTQIICFQDYPQGVPFYTNSRVVLYDYLGELEFGSKHPSGQGWFIKDKQDLIKLWENNPNAILVIPTKYKDEAFKTLDLTDKEIVTKEKYMVVRH